MLEPGSEFDLALEAFRTDRLCQRRMEHLECDGTFVPEVLREVNGGHAPSPELALDEVAVGQSGLEAISSGVGQLEVLHEVR